MRRTPAKYGPTKLMLYQECPRIIKRLRIPGMSFDSVGRRSGEPNLDECAGAHDMLYALMSEDAIKFLAKQLHRTPLRVWEALCLTVHTCEGGMTPPAEQTTKESM